MNNKIIEVQEILFKEMKRLDDNNIIDFNDEKKTNMEFQRSTALYNTSTAFIKSLNAQLSIMNYAKREGSKYNDLMGKLGLFDEKI